MKVVGLTGGIGSGKSTVVRMCGDLGVHWVDADDVAREVVEPGTPALASIAEHFGQDLLQASGALDRPRLRGIVLREPTQREWLEGPRPPAIRDEPSRKIPPDHNPLPTALVLPTLHLETDQHHQVETCQ